MAGKTSLSPESLIALGPDVLARLILEEADGNPAFRKRVKAALAGTKGPAAVAALIDRRLAALERGRAMIAWEKERALAEDLAATLQTIRVDLAALDPAASVQRLLRFIDSHASLFNRIDDSSGRIQDVYWQASEALPELVERMQPADRVTVPDRLIVSLARATHPYARQMAVAVVPLLSDPVLDGWDQALARQEETDSIFAVRQAIAVARQTLDLYLELEQRRPTWQQNPVRVAETLLAAGRLDDALAWVRREDGKSRCRFVAVGEDSLPSGRLHDVERIALETRILDARNERAAAQTLRWECFAATLHPQMLRDYLRKLEDFIEYEEQERAFALAEDFRNPYGALDFFVGWPRLDRAAALVRSRRADWDGRHYSCLVPAAEALAEAHPLAATILYRALLADILARAKSPAYGHGARHLARLDALASDINDWDGLDPHDAYRLALRQSHGRKTGFWAQVAARAGK
ncbi:DUF6880 family protein [Phaeospirillum tilakii]|uniref:DUF6880 family protein n=1 Tax=Phaeospirillum tilakii TaxID=741673 RepID=A0ABW5CEL4_9PROT